MFLVITKSYLAVIKDLDLPPVEPDVQLLAVKN